MTSRVVGIDINPHYLAAVRERFPRLRGLELVCADLGEQEVALSPVALVHAALIFEHAGTGRCLDSALSLVAPGGALAVVLQLPSQAGCPAVASHLPSMERLKDGFALVEPGWLAAHLSTRGLVLTAELQRAVPAGKSFWMGLFRTPAG